MLLMSSHFRFQREIKQIQKDEKTKRDAEREMRKGKQLRQGEVVFRCRNCDSFGFVSSDVRKIEGIHHIVKDLDYRERSIERLYPPKEYGKGWEHSYYCIKWLWLQVCMNQIKTVFPLLLNSFTDAVDNDFYWNTCLFSILTRDPVDGMAWTLTWTHNCLTNMCTEY